MCVCEFHPHDFHSHAVADVLRYIPSALHDALKKAPSEAVLLDNYARVCVILSEIVREVGLQYAAPPWQMATSACFKGSPNSSFSSVLIGHRGDY